MPRSIINILGLQRSGTSMLSSMLAHGTGVAACGEIGGWYRLARYRERAEAPAGLEFVADTPPAAFHRTALKQFGVQTIVDSSKSLEWALEVNRWYLHSDIDVYNVLIWKSPVHHAYSFWKRGLRQSLSPRYYAWPFYHRRLLRSGAEFITVQYEELIADPQPKLQALCAHVGIPYFEGKEKFWKDEFTLVGSSPGVEKQMERGDSTLSIEPFHPDFEPVGKRVRQFARKDGRVQYVMNHLSQNEIDHAPSGLHKGGHRYNPSAIAAVEQAFWRIAKDALLRFRWNTLQSLFGHNVGRLYLRYFTPDIKGTAGSYDPGETNGDP